MVGDANNVNRAEKKTEKDGKWRNSCLVLNLLAKITWVKDAQIRKCELNIAN